MTREELNFIGAMNECDEISNEAYKKIVCHVEETIISDDCVSRQAVEKGMIKYGFHAPDMTVTEFIEDELPPVTLKIPTSEDCVSRAEILQMIEDIQNAGGFIGYNTYSEAFDQVDNMPSVTPTRKQGKWDKGYGFPDGAYWKCSCCNELIKVRYPMNYCPNCGAYMGSNENENISRLYAK